MFSFDYMTTTPLDELQSAWERVPSSEFCKIGSFEGRAVCVWKVCYHTLAIFLKPVLYVAGGISIIALDILSKKEETEVDSSIALFDFGFKLVLTGLVAPIGQICQLAKAGLGILHPGCYFKEDELDQYFVQLVEIAEEVDCEPEFIEILKKGSEIIYKAQQLGDERIYYQALFKRDLEMLCEKLRDPNLTANHKAAILDMLAPLPDDPLATGIYACSPGLGRLLEEMCYCLNIPQKPEETLSWLVNQYKIGVLNIMCSKTEIIHKYAFFKRGVSEKPYDPSHFSNVLVATFGEQIGLPKEIVDSASQDMIAKITKLSEDNQKELIEIFNQLYKEEDVLDFLVQRINSQPDGGPGLKKFRNYIIQKLAENVDEKDLKSSKESIQELLGVSEILAEDSVYYVQLHYYLHLDVEPSDERSSDLNAEGIKAFATLQNYHF